MAVEIGNLVLKGVFGPQRKPEKPRDITEQLEDFRRQILSDVREMLEEAARRERER